jgi:hypothetical protein
MTERRIGRWVARAVLAVGVVMVIVRWGAVSATGGAPGDSVWDQIFAAREVVTAARVALILGCIYLAGTFIALSVEGRWLVRAGPAGAEVEGLRVAQILDEESRIVAEDVDREVTRLTADLVAVKDGVSVVSDKIVGLQDNVDILFEALDDIQDREPQ